MTSTEKKYKNREYYQCNREVIKNRARERYHMQKKREEKAPGDAAKTVEPLSLVPDSKAPVIAEPAVVKLIPDDSWSSRFGFTHGLDLYQQYEVTVVSQDLRVTSSMSQKEGVPEPANLQDEKLYLAAESTPSMESESEKLPADLRIQGQHTEKMASQTESSAWLRGLLWILSSPALFFQVLFITGLTSILTAMQIGFYRAHDIFPELAVPLAIACELSLLYLVAIRCQGISNWMRIGIYALLFGYIVSSLSFDVFYQSRNQLKESVRQAPGPSATRSEMREALKQAQAALETATKGRSWKNMALFGEQVSSIQKRISEFHEPKEFGVTDSETTFFGAVLLVVLRGLLMGVNSMAVCGLRGGFLATIAFGYKMPLNSGKY